MSGYTVPLIINGTTTRHLIVHIDLSSGKQVNQKVVAVLLRELKTCLEDTRNVTHNHAKAIFLSFLCDGNAWAIPILITCVCVLFHAHASIIAYCTLFICF